MPVSRNRRISWPAVRLRKVAAPDLMSVLGLLMGHPREERLQRAMAHFRQALNQLDPQNRVLSAESLWMAIDNLTRVVFDRLCHEHGIDPRSRDAKHQVAVALGFQPRKLEVRSEAVQALIDSGDLSPNDLKCDNSHLDTLDAHIRMNILLAADKECYTGSFAR